MQKLETEKLYIVGLFIVTGREYKNEEEIMSRKFLKWIVVENLSDDYSVYFKDIKTKINYSSYGFDIGDLYIDMNTLFSFTNLTNKLKLSKEEIYLYLKDFKTDYNLTKLKNRKIVYEIINELIKEFGEEANVIIDKVMDKFNEESPENMKRFLDNISDSLDLNEKKYTKSRRR